jgi:hypothetical protein
MSGGDPIFEAKDGSMQTHAVNGALAIGMTTGKPFSKRRACGASR